MSQPDKGNFTPESAISVSLDGSQDSGRGRERFSWKKLAVHLGFIAGGAVIGTVIGGVSVSLANSVIGMDPAWRPVFELAGEVAGMFAGALLAASSTSKMSGTIYF
jgi:hypothetical protein